MGEAEQRVEYPKDEMVRAMEREETDRLRRVLPLALPELQGEDAAVEMDQRLATSE